VALLLIHVLLPALEPMNGDEGRRIAETAG
jgi:hypothetical protein